MCCKKCAVYDTYVTKKSGTMHFDVIVDASTPHEKTIEYGKEFLNIADDSLSSTNLQAQSKNEVFKTQVNSDDQ